MLLESLGILALLSVLLVFFFPRQRYQRWREQHIRPAHAPISITLLSGLRLTLGDYLAKPTNKPEISLVVPSYNEEARLPVMLADVADYFKKRGTAFEVVVANDGSRDGTTAVALAEGKRLALPLVVVEYPKNRGKGGAVKAGVAAARGDYVLMVDADGATTFSELDRVWGRLRELQSGLGHPLVMVVGSRRHLEEEGKVERKLHRRIVSAVFKGIITVLLGIRTRDTQCGFKLFTRESAQLLFRTLHVERFAFDVELFFLCGRLGVQTGEVGVEWRDVDGSKLSVMDASVNMLRDVAMIRLKYLLGVWRDSDRVVVE